jgi:hypothetical protein
MTEFMQEVVLAVRTLGAAIAVLGDALPTIQFRPLGDPFDDHVGLCVGVPPGIRENQLRWHRVAPLLNHLELLDQRSW